MLGGPGIGTGAVLPPGLGIGVDGLPTDEIVSLEERIVRLDALEHHLNQVQMQISLAKLSKQQLDAMVDIYDGRINGLKDLIGSLEHQIFVLIGDDPALRKRIKDLGLSL